VKRFALNFVSEFSALFYAAFVLKDLARVRILSILSFGIHAVRNCDSCPSLSVLSLRAIVQCTEALHSLHLSDCFVSLFPMHSWHILQGSIQVFQFVVPRVKHLYRTLTHKKKVRIICLLSSRP